MEDKYLPIGTIVLLKDDISMYMVLGYLNKDVNNKISDYISVPFPYGFLSTLAIKTFNHSDIEKEVFKGYKNEQFQKMNSYLKDKNIGKENE